MYIDYKSQPTSICCGQTCLAMILWRSVDEIFSIMKKRGKTNTKDLVTVFGYFGIPTSKRLIRKTKQTSLPKLCIVKIKHRDYKETHWTVYHDGVFYDPAIGIVSGYDEEIKLLSYLEILKEPVIDYEK